MLSCKDTCFFNNLKKNNTTQFANDLFNEEETKIKDGKSEYNFAFDKTESSISSNFDFEIITDEYVKDIQKEYENKINQTQHGFAGIPSNILSKAGSLGGQLKNLVSFNSWWKEN